MVFDKDWFRNHQKILLFFCNNFVLKYWARRFLGIYKDVRWSEKISQLLPNNYKVCYGVSDKGVVGRAEYRTDNYFADRIYSGLYPLWWCFHQWDMLIANKYNKKLNLGFDTTRDFLVASTVASGSIRNGDNAYYSWSEIRGTSDYGRGINRTNGNVYFLYVQSYVGGETNKWNAMYRGYWEFDTNDVVSVTSASLQVKGSAKANSYSSEPDYHVVAFNPTTRGDAVAADYNNFGSTSFGSVSYTNYSTSGFSEITLNSSGRSNISTSGLCGFGFRTSWDLNNSPPTWGNNLACNIGAEMGGSSGTKLTVTGTFVAIGPVNLKSYNTNLSANIKSINTNLIANVKSLNTNV